MRALSQSAQAQISPCAPGETPSPPAASAPHAGLCFVTDTQPGIRRYRRGQGYLYTMPASPAGRPTPIHEEATLARIKALAIPDSWRQVWISPTPDGHLQATGRDNRGRRQSRHHPQWRIFRDQTRFEHMLRFSEILPAMRARVESDLRQPGMPLDRILATLIRLMDIAAGTGVHEAADETGIAKPVSSRPGGALWFQINGRGKKHRIDIGDSHLKRIVCEYIDLPGFELFQYIDSNGRRVSIGCSEINAYVRSSTGGEFTARDFRTWCGSLLAFEFLSGSPPPSAKDEADQRVSEAIRRVSRRLLHSPAACRKCLIHPAVIESYLAGAIRHWLGSAGSEGSHRHADFDKLDINERRLFCLIEDWAAKSSQSPTA